MGGKAGDQAEGDASEHLEHTRAIKAQPGAGHPGQRRDPPLGWIGLIGNRNGMRGRELWRCQPGRDGPGINGPPFRKPERRLGLRGRLSQRSLGRRSMGNKLLDKLQHSRWWKDERLSPTHLLRLWSLDLSGILLLYCLE